ncbi:DUF2806 domain-containing protein [Sphingomonas mali]|uniref:DUF2806 domain-containing protein n=1 Tax=Sphingomonas mali TaxID=40682 RepID=UPI0009FF564A|nr:DUF2806 domain-containing protein [Sphingomonas mali]
MDTEANNESNSVWSIIASSVKSGLPKTVESVLHLVGVRLLGKLVEIPEAWAEGKAQKIRDMTAARSALSSAVAKLAVESGTANPAIWTAASDLLLQDLDRKLSNKAAVFVEAARLTAEASVQNPDNELKPPSDDWLNIFERYAEDATSDSLRETYSRILSGEILRSGSFSIAALRVVSELTQEIASTFSEVYANSFNEYVAIYPKYEEGLQLRKIVDLRDAGFFYAGDLSFTAKPPTKPIEGISHLLQVGNGTTLRIVLKGGDKFYIPPSVTVAQLTRMGREIATILPKPDAEVNLRAIYDHLRGTDGDDIVAAAIVKPDGSELILFESI